MLTLDAPAKINLFLSVGPKGDDGYHEIQSIMQAVWLADTLTFDALPGGLTFDVEGDAPEDESNLVVRAVRTLWGALGVTHGAAIRLKKRIPIAAGLAGGSADAAATLVALNRLWNTGLSRKALEKIGASIGSDVPFCIRGGTAIARGRGEILTPVPLNVDLWWVIVMPGGALSTADVYARFDGMRTPAQIVEPVELVDALARGDVERIGAELRNDLREPAQEAVPDIAVCIAALEEAGAVAASMSGSGPSCIGLARDESDATRIAKALSGRFPFVEAVRSRQTGPNVRES